MKPFHSLFHFPVLVLLLVLPLLNVTAQNKTFGVGATTLNPNAALQVDAPNGNQGVLIPRLTTTQRLAMKTNLAAADAGLLVYDTTEKAVFVWVGTDWESSAAIAWPLEDTITNVPNRSNLLNLTYSGTDTVGIAMFRSTNANNTFATLFLESEGGRIVFGSTRSAISPGADFRINNTANNQNAIVGSTNGSGRAIQGTNTGTGAAGNFTINNAANPANAVFVQTNGTGPGVSMTLSNATNASPAININHSGTGNAITANRPIQATGFIGDGSQLTNLAVGDLTYPFKDSVTTALAGNDVFALKYNNAANKRVLRVESLSPTNGSSALSVQQNGTGLGIFSRIDNPTAGTSAIFGTTNSNLGGPVAPVGVYGESTGTGSLAASFRINNTENTFPAVFVETNGSGPGINVRNIGATNGIAGLFSNTVDTNTFPAIQASTAGVGPGVRVIQNTTSQGRGMDVFMQNPSSTETGISIEHQGLGSAARFSITNEASGAPGIASTTSGSGAAIEATTSTGFTAVYAKREGSSNGNAGLFEITNADNGFPVVQVNSVGKGPALNVSGSGSLGNAGAFSLTNSSSTAAALYASTNGSGSAFLAETSSGFTAVRASRSGAGNGNAGFFEITDAGNTFPAIQSNTVGTGAAGNFKVTNESNTGPAVMGETNGGNLSSAVYGLNTGNGFGVLGRANGTAFGSAAVYGEQLGTGDAAGAFRISNPSNTMSGLYGETNGSGSALFANNIGTGRGAQVQINNAANSQAALRAFTNGTGNAGFFTINNAANTTSALVVTTDGTGFAGEFRSTNIAHNTATLGAESNSNAAGSAAIGGRMIGTGGPAGYFEIANAANNFAAVTGVTNGTSGGGYFQNTNTANSFSTLTSLTNGTGPSGYFQNTNATNTNATVYSLTNGTGNAIAIRGDLTNAANTAAGVYGSTVGTGVGVYGITTGTGAAIQGYTATGATAIYGKHDGASNGNAGRFEITNAGNAFPSLEATTVGTGTGLLAQIVNTANSANALRVLTNGTGNGILVNHTGASGNLAVLQNAGSNVARIDKTGKGFFNGGTQTGGADLAEMFDVEGSRQNYEPGDVLVISERTDRTVEKSASPVSTKVVGVYATKPGVVLTERGLDESLSDMVPMGVIGVIPTKVCNENGPIKRGDLLVTSSKPGHAMKAVSEKGDGVFPSGAVIGKALENFEAGETGLIKVLVNVK